MDFDALVPASAAAAALKVSRQLINWWVSSGKIEPKAMVGRSPVYRWGDLLEVERATRRSPLSRRNPRRRAA